jgi:hypothetical protein
MIVIGSRAFSYYFKDEKSIPKDWDLIMSYEEFSKWSKKHDDLIISMVPTSDHKYNIKVKVNEIVTQYEIELENQSSSLWLLNNASLFKEELVDELGDSYKVMSPIYQMLTKRSHVYFPIHIGKTLNSYSNLKRLTGSFVMDKDMVSYYKLRFGEANERFSKKYKTRNLNVTNDKFFDNKIVKPLQVLEHDTLHSIVKHQDKPIYEMMKHDDKVDFAWCEQDLFQKLKHIYKVQSVLEESYVISLERFIIPNKEVDLYKSFLLALHKVCTTLCSGWFRDFAIENYEEIVKSYKADYFEKYITYTKG